MRAVAVLSALAMLVAIVCARDGSYGWRSPPCGSGYGVRHYYTYYGRGACRPRHHQLTRRPLVAPPLVRP